MAEENEPEVDFFDELEKSVDTIIPPFLRAILRAAGFNDQLTLRSVYTDFQSITDYVDSDDGIEQVKGLLGAELLQVDERYLRKPSSFLKIPGNKIRLKGIQDFFESQKQSLRDKQCREDRKTQKLPPRNDRSRSPLQSNTPKAKEDQLEESDKANLLTTIKTQVRKLKIVPTQQSALENPKIEIYLKGNKKHASVSCLVCASTEKDKVSTAYGKGSKTWLISNYKRHIERIHLVKTPSKDSGSLDKFVQKQTTSQDHNSTGSRSTNIVQRTSQTHSLEENSNQDQSFTQSQENTPNERIVELSDDEEEARRNRIEHENFLRKE